MQSEPAANADRMATRPKFWLVVLSIALVGYLMGYHANPRHLDKTTAQPSIEFPQSQELDAVRRLNEIDEPLIEHLTTVVDLAADSMGVAGDIFGKWNRLTIADLTSATEQVNRNTTQIEALKPQINARAEQRSALLKELGIE